jgi:hypothetical protein
LLRIECIENPSAATARVPEHGDMRNALRGLLSALMMLTGPQRFRRQAPSGCPQ